MNLRPEFISTYLTPAHPIFFSRELCCYPRQKKIRPLHCEDKINDSSRKFRLERISDNGYRRIRCSINREYGDNRKYWHFTRYAADSWLDFISIDVDDHHDTDDKWDVARRLNALGLPILWTRSPGMVCGNGEEKYGFYAHIFLTAPVMLDNLQPIAAQIRRITELPSIELPATLLNCKGMTTNYRFPFQHKCDVVQLDLDNEVCIPLAQTFQENMKYFEQREKIDFIDLCEILNNLEDTKKVVKEPVPITKPTKFHTYKNKGGAQPDAFKRSTFIASQLIRERNAQGQPDDYLTEAKERFTSESLPHGFVDHINRPQRLDRLLMKSLKYFINPKHYDPTKMNLERRKKKDIRDRQRFEKTLTVIVCMGEDRLFRRIKEDGNFTYKEIVALRTWFRDCTKYDGRLAAKCIYNHRGNNPKAPFANVKEWRNVCKKLIAMNILQDPNKNDDTKYSIENHICCQWLFNMPYLEDIKIVCSNVDEILSESNKQKKKQYMGTHHAAARLPAQTEPDDALYSLINTILDDIANPDDYSYENATPEIG